MCKGKPTEVHGPMPLHLINVRCHGQLLTTGSPGSPSDGLLSGDSLPHSSLLEPSLVIPQGKRAQVRRSLFVCVQLPGCVCHTNGDACA